MSGYTIGEIAQRSGFSSSALRYYERLGLVAPSTRTEAGYRVYDDGALARLAFIARAKQLGCSLEEILALVEIWDGERCGPVQRRFHDLVTDKVAGAERQIAELVAFVHQLRSAAVQLGAPPVDVPCGEECACMGEPDHAPVACTLEPEAQPGRLAEWQAVLERVRGRVETPDGGLRIQFDDDVSVQELAHLVQAEQACCAFFSFAITIDPRGVALEVRAPTDAREVMTSLFAAPSRTSESLG
jgi:DNA-binding transcriptional MerR regulator